MKRLNRVVRDHRQLLHIAPPERESEPTSTFSVAEQLDRTIAERVVFAVWLPFISAAGAVMLARRDERQTERARQQ
jgi:hypothetical protein